MRLILWCEKTLQKFTEYRNSQQWISLKYTETCTNIVEMAKNAWWNSSFFCTWYNVLTSFNDLVSTHNSQHRLQYSECYPYWEPVIGTYCLSTKVQLSTQTGQLYVVKYWVEHKSHKYLCWIKCNSGRAIQSKQRFSTSASNQASNSRTYITDYWLQLIWISMLSLFYTEMGWAAGQ